MVDDVVIKFTVSQSLCRRDVACQTASAELTQFCRPFKQKFLRGFEHLDSIDSDDH